MTVHGVFQMTEKHIRLDFHEYTPSEMLEKSHSFLVNMKRRRLCVILIPDRYPMR